MIPDALQVSGSDTDEAKERKLLAFASGECRVLITKPKIGAFGLNWQHCAHHSYGAVMQGRRGIGIELKETYYRQALRNLQDAESSRPIQTSLFDA